MNEGAGLLFSQMEPAPAQELDFHRWYDTEHIPPRMALSGFDSAVRYVCPAGEPWHLACYHISDMGVLETPGYRRLKSDPGASTQRIFDGLRAFTRYLCDLQSDTGPVSEPASRLSVVAFDVPEADREEFDGWYEDEHVPLLLTADGWLRVRRYTVQPGFEGPPWTHLALHELRDEAALDAPERAAARDTHRRDSLATREWFGRSGRWLYRPIASATATHANAHPQGA